MSTQPEALRLVDVAFAARDARWHTQADDELRRLHVDAIETAAELRRLHAENERLQARYEASRIAAHQWLDKTEWIQETVKGRELGMHRADVVRQRLSAVEAQRDALLEALQDLCDTLGECGMTEKARAAIAKAEGA